MTSIPAVGIPVSLPSNEKIENSDQKITKELQTEEQVSTAWKTYEVAKDTIDYIATHTITTAALVGITTAALAPASLTGAVVIAGAKAAASLGFLTLGANSFFYTIARYAEV